MTIDNSFAMIEGYDMEIADLKTNPNCDSALWCIENNIDINDEIANLEAEKQELIAKYS